ncbi:hypothetical protein ACSZNF_00920 [Aeromonas hydrophila]
MDDEKCNQLRRAFNAYLDESKNTTEPNYSYLSYDFDFVHGHRLSLLGEHMVEDELREITNILNRWHSNLHRWYTWNNVLRGCSENEAWYVRCEFADTLIHHCLLEPSAVRDRVTFVATNAFHQVRLSCEKSYKDRLDNDPKQVDGKPVILSRQKKEKQLERILSIWPESQPFIESLKAINDIGYQNDTFNYRNRVSHAIGPRLARGITQLVTRSVVQATRMQEQPDGTYIEEPIPETLSVSYGFGGTLPVDLENAWQLNLRQYQLSRTCYEQYIKLLRMAVKSIKRRAN